jgi:hypothetical protein
VRVETLTVPVVARHGDGSDASAQWRLQTNMEGQP